MSNNDAFDLGDFEDFDAPSLSPEDDVDFGPVAGTQAPRNTRFILLATVLVVVILVGAVGIVLAALDAGQKQRDYQATVNSVNMTNAQVALYITQTNIAKSWTYTPSPTLTPSFTPTPTFTNTPTPSNTPTYTPTIDTTGTQAALDAQASGTAAILTLTYNAQQLTQTAIARLGTINALTLTANVPATATTAAGPTASGNASIGDLVKTIQANDQTLAAINNKQATASTGKKSLNEGQGVALQITATPTPSMTRAFLGGVNGAAPNKNAAYTAVALINQQAATPTDTPTSTATPTATGSPDVSIPTLIPLGAITATLPPSTPDIDGSATAAASITPATVSPEDANATANAQEQNLIATNNAIANQIATLAAQTASAPGGGGNLNLNGSAIPVEIKGGVLVIVTNTPLPTSTGTVTKTIGKAGFFDDLAAGKATPGSLAVVGLAAVSLVAVIVAARRMRTS